MTDILVGPGRLNVKGHIAGDTLNLSCDLGDTDESAWTWTAEIHLQGNPANVVPLDVDYTDADTGTIVVIVDEDDAADIPPGRHTWELIRNDPDQIKTVLAGDWSTYA